jgi:outer membrane protein TolC
MRNLFIVIAVTASLVFAASGSQLPAAGYRPPPCTLSLAQAQDYALQHSRDIAATRIQIDKATARIDEVLANYYPVLGTQLTSAYLSNVSVLALPLGPGGQMVVVPLSAHANYDARLTLSQTLYSGGRIELGRQMAELARTFQQDSLTLKKQNLAYDVHQAFNSVLLLQQLLELTRQSRQLAQDHLAVVDTLYQSGYVSRYDVVRTSVQVDNIAPQITQLENGIQMALEAFKLTIGMPLDQDVELQGKLEEPPDSISEQAALDSALADRTELKMLAEDVRLTQLNRSMTKANYIPAVGASAIYDFERPAGIGGSGWGSNLTLALGLNYTLFDGMKTRAQLRQADYDLKTLALYGGLARDGIATEVKEAVTSIRTAQAAVVAARGSIGAAEEGVKLAEARYAEGHGANLDVLDAQLALFQAQVGLLTAINNEDVAHARLIEVMGK